MVNPSSARYFFISCIGIMIHKKGLRLFTFLHVHGWHGSSELRLGGSCIRRMKKYVFWFIAGIELQQQRETKSSAQDDSNQFVSQMNICDKAGCRVCGLQRLLAAEFVYVFQFLFKQACLEVE